MCTPGYHQRHPVFGFGVGDSRDQAIADATSNAFPWGLGSHGDATVMGCEEFQVDRGSAAATEYGCAVAEDCTN